MTLMYVSEIVDYDHDLCLLGVLLLLLLITVIIIIIISFNFHAGSLELGSAGVSVNIFNYISKLFNIPLLSVATSFVAEDISKNEIKASVSGEVKLIFNSQVILVRYLFWVQDM